MTVNNEAWGREFWYTAKKTKKNKQQQKEKTEHTDISLRELKMTDLFAASDHHEAGRD